MFIAAVQIVQNLEEYYIQSKLIAQINENLLIFGNEVFWGIYIQRTLLRMFTLSRSMKQPISY